MELFLMQHGQSCSKEENPDQPLSREGTTAMNNVAKAMGRLNLKFDLIISSTKTRAIQTAEIIAKELGYSTEEIVKTNDLVPMASVEAMLNVINTHREFSRILITGHLPALPLLSSYLLTQDEHATTTVGFQNGGLCSISYHPESKDPSVLNYYIPPDILSKVK